MALIRYEIHTMNFMKIIIIISALVFTMDCTAQQIRSPALASYPAMGAYSRNFTDVFSFIHNQAALSKIKKPQAGIYAENRFMLKELKLVTAVAAMPFQKGGVGLSVNYSGYANYNEAQIGFAYGRALGDKANLGIQFNYNAHHTEGYDNLTAVCFEIAAVFHLSEKMHTGIHAYNPVGGRFNQLSGEKLAASYTLGLGYEASEKLLINAELIKEEIQPVSVHAALHYAFEKMFYIRCGTASGYDRSFAAIGLSRNDFRLDMSLSWHRLLGITPSLRIISSLK